MKYLPLRDFDTVTNALNFSTPDCHVIGGCDLYTTKAAGGDKKLYKNIENSLETQYESLVRLSASLSPPYRSAASDDGKPHIQRHGGHDTEDVIPRGKKRSRTVEPPSIDLSRASPFGPLSQINARRTFAYLIATLNASHPDYDFSHLLRPSDFRKERSLRSIMAILDSTLQNLRPRSTPGGSAFLAPPTLGVGGTSPAPAVGGLFGGEENVWSPRMWSLIDKEMGLRQCEKYSYVPDDDPFDGEEGAIWSLHYFFFNKERKRVCYLYLRGLSVISHSPVHAPVLLATRSHHQKNAIDSGLQRKVSAVSSVGDGAGKRAQYWLGPRYGGGGEIDTSEYGEDDDDEMVVDAPGDDEVEEVPGMDLDEVRFGLNEGYYYGSYEDDGDIAEEMGDVDGDAGVHDAAPPRHVRGVSEEVGAMIEV